MSTTDNPANAAGDAAARDYVSVDIHSHLIPQLALERIPDGLKSERAPQGDKFSLVAEDIRSLARGVPRDLRDIDRHRARQAERGVDLSIIGPWMDAIKMPLDSQLQHKWCRVINESFAELLDDSAHSRFVAGLPDLDGGAAAAELERAAEQGAVGGMLMANPELGTLARRDFAPLWETAERLGLPIILHPASVDLDSRMRQHQANILVGNPFETTMAALSLIAGRIPERFPDLKIVLVHGGGFFPYQYGRMTAGFSRWPELDSSKMLAPIDYVKWFYYDTVLFERPPLQYLIDVAGVDHVLAGSDCPFPMTDYEPYENPEHQLGLNEAETRAIVGGNAAALFGLHPATAGSATDRIQVGA
jgi:Predicted metal-dependent hydrolase of the TIM-barrel fold